MHMNSSRTNIKLKNDFFLNDEILTNTLFGDSCWYEDTDIAIKYPH